MTPRVLLTVAVLLSLTTMALAFWSGTSPRFHAVEAALHGLVVATVPGPIMPIAVVFSFWDRLMGTQWHDHTEYPDTGIRDRGFPYEESTSPAGALRDYARQMIYPFRAIWNASKGRGWEIDG